MTPEQEAAIAAAEADTLSKRERALLKSDDDVPTLDDFEEDRSDPFTRLLDDIFEADDEDDDDFFIEEYDDEKGYQR